MDPKAAKDIEHVQRVTDKTAHGIDEVETFRKDWTNDEERRAKRKLVSTSAFTTTRYTPYSILNGSNGISFLG